MAFAAGRVIVADEVVIATALLHKEQPEREDFTLKPPGSKRAMFP